MKQTLNNFQEHDIKVHDVIIATDSNFPDIKWVNGTGHIQPGRDHGHLSEDRLQATALLEFADELFLHQIITSPTRRNNILDLIFTNNTNIINDQTIICNEKLSDHYVIQLDMNYDNQVNKETRKEKTNHSKTNLNKYDFQGASDELWYRFNLLMQEVNFDLLFENLNTTEKLNVFYSEVSRIKKSLVAYLEANQKMNQNQHGFRQG